ncbi:MAG TPA: DNA primase, partial [Desulfurivibrionaceae bacterium]|nr:DNA primase [Desulfurivibrionaceae bacterium]
KDAADILEIIGEVVSLKKAGVNYKGCCPFHSEKTPSFTVNPQRGSFHCFGCSEGGDVFSFYMKYHNTTFPEALQNLARRYNVLLPEKPLSHQDQARARQKSGLHEVLEKSAAIYHELLVQGAEAAGARRYLAERGIPPETTATFKLGYAPESWDFLARQLAGPGEVELAIEAGLLVKKERGGHYDRFRDRLLCPIFNLAGQVAGFSGRILGEGQPKYMNSPESPVYDKSRLLFGLYQNREAIRRNGRCLLVEGNFDLLALAARGVNYAAAPLGTALTVQQVRTLKGYAEEAVILFDGDAAGLKAAARAVPIFLAEELPARVVVLPTGHDPDTFVSEFGREKLEEEVAQAMPLADFVFTSLVARYGPSLEGKAKIGAELRTMLAGLAGHQLQHSLFVAHFSEKLGISPEQLVTGKEAKAAAAPAPPPSRTHTEKSLPQKQKQLLEFLIIFPEYLQKFLEAGIEIMITSSFGRIILDHLREATRYESGRHDRLLDLAAGPEKAFISRLLITAPSFTAEAREEAAAEKLAWLRQSHIKFRQEELTKQINAAQKTGDFERCMELIEQKKGLDQELSAQAAANPIILVTGENR